MYEVCHHLPSLSFVDISGKYVIIICIFVHKTVIRNVPSKQNNHSLREVGSMREGTLFMLC